MEGGFAQLPLTNIFVAIQVGAEGTFGIIGVDNFDVGEAEDFFGRRERLLQTFGGGDIEAGGEEMAGVKAVAEGEMRFPGSQITDHAELFEPGANLIAGADGVFEEDGNAFRVKALSGLREAEDEGGDTLFEGLAFVISRVKDEVFRSYGGGPVQFSAEGCNGFGADVRVEAGQVGEVVVVNDERADIEPFAGGAEASNIIWVGP